MTLSKLSGLSLLSEEENRAFMERGGGGGDESQLIHLM